MQIVQDVVTWLKSWFYDKSEVYNKSESYSKSEVDNALANKLNSNLTTANKNLVTNGSGDVVLEDKVDVSGKIDTAGTGLSKSGTTLNHSNSITAQTSNVFKKFKYDAQGHITGTTDVSASDLPSHNHTISNVTDLQTSLDDKVDKVTGKGLSSEDFTSTEKTKLANIEAEANKTVVDSVLSSSSANPLQNKVISSKVSEIETTLSNLGTEDIVEISALSNIATRSNATQHQVNVAIDTAIGNLSSVDAVKVVSTLPTASSSTMGALYIISENSKVNVYYTEQNGSSYAWHKMDTDILDELSIDWSDVQNKPFSSVDTALSSTSTNPVQNKVINTALSGKAPTSHSSTATTYGVGTTSNYGHCKTVNGLTTSTHSNGLSLSAYQGYVLKGLIDDLGDDLTDLEDTVNAISSTTLPYTPNPNDWGEASQGATTVSNALTLLKQIQNTKQDKGDCITSIELVPKSSDVTGAIKLYYGDEPSNNS